MSDRPPASPSGASPSTRRRTCTSPGGPASRPTTPPGHCAGSCTGRYAPHTAACSWTPTSTACSRCCPT
jgi:hypothetical protein